jgi:hypothetical protein
MTVWPNADQVTAVVRWLITWIGGVLIAKGYGDDSYLQLALGLAGLLVPFVWTLATKTQAAKLKAAAGETGVTVIVGPEASEAAKDLARNPTVSNVVLEEDHAHEVRL